MKCAVNWIPLRIRVRSRNTQPHLKRAHSMKSSLQSISSNYFVETNQLFGSNPHEILTRQTCSQCLGIAAGSKRRVLAFCTNLLYVLNIEM